MTDWSNKYEMVVGLEVHVQLKTRAKAGGGCSADFGAPPSSFDFTVAQLSALYGPGHAAQSTFTA